MDRRGGKPIHTYNNINNTYIILYLCYTRAAKIGSLAVLWAYNNNNVPAKRYRFGIRAYQVN